MRNVLRVFAQTLTATAAVAALTVALPAPAAAQSTIFNIPTTDTLSPGKGYFEFDYLLQTPGPDSGTWQVFMPRIVAGVTPQLEVGLNWNNTTYSDDGGTYSYVQPNAKFKFFNNDDAGVAASAGVIGYVAANKRDSSDDFGMVYGLVSKKFKESSYGPRITGGVYGSLSYGDDETGGVILGYEQPLSSTISFVADWFSGENFWGYFTPGVSIVLPKQGLLNVGYSLGNDSSNDNHAFFIYYGITFP